MTGASRLRSVRGSTRWTRRRRVWSIALTYLVFPVVSRAAAPLLSTNLPPLGASLPDAGVSVIRLFGALTLVLGLFLGGVWLFKNWQRVTLGRGRSSRLHIIETKALGGKHALYVVGYQQQRLLLASSPSGVSLVSHLPEEDISPDVSPSLPPTVAGESFVHALQRAVHAKAG